MAASSTIDFRASAIAIKVAIREILFCILPHDTSQEYREIFKLAKIAQRIGFTLHSLNPGDMEAIRRSSVVESLAGMKNLLNSMPQDYYSKFGSFLKSIEGNHEKMVLHLLLRPVDRIEQASLGAMLLDALDVEGA